MKLPHPTRRQWIGIGIIFFAIYTFGYFATRHSALLVHRVGFETRTNGTKIYHHSIETGDFSPGKPYFTRYEFSVTFRQQNVAYRFFTPLRWSEIVFWHFIPRTYEF
jgi:hypothetical protein